MFISLSFASAHTVLFSCSLFRKSCRTDRALAMWWLFDPTAPQAGCRQPYPPLKHPDTSLKMRAFSPSPLSKSRLGFTTTWEKGHLDLLPLSTLLRKVCMIWSRSACLASSDSSLKDWVSPPFFKWQQQSRRQPSSISTCRRLQHTFLPLLF